jgi:DNA modification methylase
MIIEKKKIADLIPAPYNPRQSTAKQEKHLKESLEKFGLVEPIIFNKQTGYIVGGHFRVRELKKLGIKEIECVIVDLNEADEKELNIRLNANTGGWDWDTLANDWDVVDLEAWGLDIPQFDTVEELEASEDDYDVPEGGIETDIVIGDLFEIGEHRLLCGDSTQIDTFKALFGENLADLVITDPPYNVALGMETKQQAKARNRRTDGLTIKNDKMSDGNFYQFLYDFYTALGAYTKAGGAWYVWFADMEVVNFSKAFIDSGFKLAQMLIWKKSSLVMGRKDYHFNHEPCLYGWKEGAAHGWYSDRKQTSVFEFDKPSRNGEHPTMKPIPLFSYQIGNSSKKGDIVADGFGGSGTTMVACHQMNRKAYLVELDPKYCQVIIDRMRKLDSSLIIKRNGVELKTTK